MCTHLFMFRFLLIFLLKYLWLIAATENSFPISTLQERYLIITRVVLGRLLSEISLDFPLVLISLTTLLLLYFSPFSSYFCNSSPPFHTPFYPRFISPHWVFITVLHHAFPLVFLFQLSAYLGAIQIMASVILQMNAGQ